MGELRWNPFLNNYTMVAANRQQRPDMPKDWCPFCPGSDKIQDDYSVLIYDNDFPALSPNAEKVETDKEAFFRKGEAYGKCEVVLYSPDHYANLYELSDEHVLKLVQLWQDRFNALSADPKVKYVLIFENRGAEVGVTVPHPHGQIYAYPFVPLKQEVELKNARMYYEHNAECLSCKLNKEEIEDGRRVVTENEHFVAYVPYFTDYPFGLYIVSREHLNHIGQFSGEHKISLAKILKEVCGTFDTLYNKPFPYMMCMQQSPVNSEAYEGVADFGHFRIEFYPPLRGANRIKYMASSETAAWAATNTMFVEESAELLREALERYRASS